MRYVRAPEGHVVDLETGEIVDELESRIDAEHPEYRIFSSEDYVRKVHYSLLIRMAEEVSLGDLPPHLAALKGSASVDEAWEVLENGTIIQLAVYKCLRFMGCPKPVAFNAALKCGGSGKWNRLAGKLCRVAEEARSNALIRWVTYVRTPLTQKDLERLGEVRRTKYGPLVIIIIDGYKVQVMQRKIDISTGSTTLEDVARLVRKLEYLLGIDLTSPKPVVATIVLRPPFAISLVLAKLIGAPIDSSRVKVLREFYTMIVFRRVANLYVKLKGSIDRIDEAIADALPLICACSQFSR